MNGAIEPDPDEPHRVVFYTKDAPSARGLSPADALHEQIQTLEFLNEMMPYEMAKYGGSEVLEEARRQLAALEAGEA